VLTGDRPAVRVNQLGYLPARSKRATWVTDSLVVHEFALHASDGSVAFLGWSEPWPVRPEPTSGQAVHVVDFSALIAMEPYRVLVDGGHSHPFRIAADLYDRLSGDAFRLFYLLHCGCAIDEQRAPGYGRPAGHAGDAAVPPWSGPDAGRFYPGWSPSGHFDVSGGWYDAGDYGKYATSGSIAAWQLLNVLDLPRRTPADVQPVGQEPLVEECRWQLDWLLRLQVPPGHPLAGLAFHRVHGIEWSPLPGLPHRDPTRRVLHRPSTTATLHLAAVAAQGLRLLRPLTSSAATRACTTGSRPGSTTCWAATRWGRATSPAMAPIPPATCVPAGSATISTRCCRRHLRAPSPAGPTPCAPRVSERSAARRARAAVVLPR
jgi:endoglucanase